MSPQICTSRNQYHRLKIKIIEPAHYGLLKLHTYFKCFISGTDPLVICSDAWINLCTSCDILSSPSEQLFVTVTLVDCQQSCKNEPSCTGIDYGKNSRDQQCYHNYGGGTIHVPITLDNDFDAYIIQRCS